MQNSRNGKDYLIVITDARKLRKDIFLCIKSKNKTKKIIIFGEINNKQALVRIKHLTFNR